MKKNFLNYENYISDENIIEKKGNIPIILTAPHTIKQIKKDGQIKLSEPFTKAITMYIGESLNTHYLIKNKDTGIDANSLEEEEFKNKLINTINENDIKLVIDIHGANERREFDIELGTLNNLSADYSTINELIDAFKENGINNINLNEPFKGGGITQTVYKKTNIDVIQIEINKKYRNIDKVENIEKVCNSLIEFINLYINTLNKI